MTTTSRSSAHHKMYPSSVEVATPTGTMSIEWKALCVQLGVSKARAVVRDWERARAKTKSKVGVGVFTHSSTYGCMNYWEVTNVRYRDSINKGSKTRPMESTWSLVKAALLYKLF